MMTMTTRRGITTPTTIHKLVFSVSEGADATFSTAGEASQTEAETKTDFMSSHEAQTVPESNTTNIWDIGMVGMVGTLLSG